MNNWRLLNLNIGCRDQVITCLLILSLMVGMRPSEAVSRPTGSKEGIACLCFTNYFWQVFLLSSEKVDIQPVTESKVDKISVSWSNETDQLLVNSNWGELSIVDLNTLKEKQIDVPTRGMTDATWSINGQKVLFSLSIANSIDANDIWQMEIPSSRRKRLTNMKHMQHDPTWSHDETQVIFVSGAGGQDHDLFVLDLATGSTRQLTAGQRYHFEPACSINDEIAFSSNRSGDYEIWVCDLEGKKFEQITHSPGLDGQPTWSPDGNQIAFVSTRSGYPAIWIVNRDGSNAHQVSPGGMRCRAPAWSR